MNLHRISRDAISDHAVSSQNFRSHAGEVYLDFENFTAREKGSHFRATFDWSDVAAIVQVFVDANHPEALRLAQAQNVATAIAAFMRISN
jgi:hypothetical protein